LISELENVSLAEEQKQKWDIEEAARRSKVSKGVL
jgi:hypothetical protein